MEIYDHEAVAIKQEISHVQEKYIGKSFTAENLDRMHRELVGRMEDLGFTAVVDVTPLYEFEPVQVSITGRVERKEFDHEFKRSEIKKSKERGGI